jgi:hypothetical protein
LTSPPEAVPPTPTGFVALIAVAPNAVAIVVPALFARTVFPPAAPIVNWKLVVSPVKGSWYVFSKYPPPGPPVLPTPACPPPTAVNLIALVPGGTTKVVLEVIKTALSYLGLRNSSLEKSPAPPPPPEEPPGKN